MLITSGYKNKKKLIKKNEETKVFVILPLSFSHMRVIF